MDKKRKSTQKLYEVMYVLTSALQEEAVKGTLQGLRDSIEKRGGEIHKVHEMGRKKLAYQMKKQKHGIYYLFYFSMVPEQIKEMEREYTLNQNILRFITLQADSVMEKIEFKPLA